MFKFIILVGAIFGIICGLGFVIAGIMMAFSGDSSGLGIIFLGALVAAPSIVIRNYLKK